MEHEEVGKIGTQSTTKALAYCVETIEQKEQNRTTIKKAEFLEYLEKGMGVVKLACDAIGINRQTHYNWCSADPLFRKEVERIKRLQLDEVEDKLLKAIIKDESWAINLYLSRRHPLYRPKQENYIIPTEKTLEDLFDEYQNEDTPGQQNNDRAPHEDSEQTRSDGSVQSEPSPDVLLGEENAKKPDLESEAKGNQ